MVLLSHISQWYERKVGALDFVGGVLRKTRRSLYAWFRPDEVKRRIAETRKGECHRCGTCCELVWKCPFVGRDSQNLPYCRVYGDLRPASCFNYPFDARDSEVAACGYSFKK